MEGWNVERLEGWKVGMLEGSGNEGVLSFPQVIISDRAERRRREARREKCTRDKCTLPTRSVRSVPDRSVLS